MPKAFVNFYYANAVKKMSDTNKYKPEIAPDRHQCFFRKACIIAIAAENTTNAIPRKPDASFDVVFTINGVQHNVERVFNEIWKRGRATGYRDALDGFKELRGAVSQVRNALVPFEEALDDVVEQTEDKHA